MLTAQDPDSSSIPNNSSNMLKRGSASLINRLPHQYTSTLADSSNPPLPSYSLPALPDYTNQFASIYLTRLATLGPSAAAAARRKWSVEGGKEAVVDRRSPSDDVIMLNNSQESLNSSSYEEGNSGGSNSYITGNYPHIPKVVRVEAGQICWVVGTVYLDAPLKPSVLDEINTSYNFAPQPIQAKYTSDKDSFVLEDDSGRMQLTGDLLKSYLLVTGVVAAFLGCEMADGSFEVLDICYPESLPPPSRPICPTLTDTGGRKVILVSGLDFGSPAAADIRTSLLFDYLSAEVGTEVTTAEAASLARLVVVGNALAKPTPTLTKNKFGAEVCQFDAAPIHLLDAFLSHVSVNMHVTLIPGANDPTNHSLPQQAMPYSLLTKTTSVDSVHMATNPAAFSVQNRSFVCHDGQSLQDVLRYVEAQGPQAEMDVAKALLSWCHLAPTCPDTLPCYPFRGEDPFMVRQRPNVLVFGNATHFQTALMHSSSSQVDEAPTLIVLVPRFVETYSAVEVDLDTLTAQEVCFDVDLV